jgi:hypothetical protein
VLLYYRRVGAHGARYRESLMPKAHIILLSPRVFI